MPTTGSANYVGGAAGFVIVNSTENLWYGTSTLTATFASNAIVGTISNIEAYSASSQAPLGTINNISLSGTISGSSYSGSANAVIGTGTYATVVPNVNSFAYVRGAFYGPSAQETAGTFGILSSPYGANLLGSFGAQQSSSVTSIPTPTPMSVLYNTDFSVGSTGGVYSNPGLNSTVTDDGTTTNAFVITGNAYATLAFGDANTRSVSVLGQSNVEANGSGQVTSSLDSNVLTSYTASFADFTKTVGLSYADFGIWQAAPTSNMSGSQGVFGAYAGGQLGVSSTGTSSIPTTGSATYTGGAAGYVIVNSAANPWYGTSSLSASFATNVISGLISNIEAYSSSSQTALGSLNNIGLLGTISGSAYRGTATAISGPAGYATIPSSASGAMQGSFYGPSAQETAGTFAIQTGSSSTPSILGAFGAAALATPTPTPTSALYNFNVVSLFTTSNYNSETSADGTLATYGTTTTATFPTSNGSVTLAFNNANAQTVSLYGQSGVQTYSGIVSSTTEADVYTSSPATLADFAQSVGLSYADFGLWTALDPAQPISGSGTVGGVGAYAGGQVGVSPTLSSSMPTSGSATYTGGAVGFVTNAANTPVPWSGASSLTASFAVNSITGTISNIQAYSESGSTETLLGTVNNITLSGTISGSTYSGTAAASSGTGTYATIPTSATGTVRGAFYGPSAQETAGGFQIISSATSGPNIIGAFGAKQAVPSDMRLKTDIAPAGVLSGGLKLYSWRYLGGRHRFTGVMAQDLLADARYAKAVVVDTDGLMRVDYAAIGYLPGDLAGMASEGEAAMAIYRGAPAKLH